MATRRLRGEGGLSQRSSDGLWVGTVDLGWHNGKRVRKSVSAKTKKQAAAKFVALKREVEKGGGLGSSSTVEAWLNYWLDHVAIERVRPRTMQGYRSYVNTWLIPYLGEHRLTKLNEDHIRAMYRAMKVAGKSDSTRRQAHMILRRALVVAEREHRISRNPAAMVDPPPTGTKHRTPLTLSQARKVLANLDGDPLAARWIAALLMGLRQGEALGLKWADVDRDAGTIHVTRELLRIKGLGLVETDTKSKASDRFVPILPPMAYALDHTEHRGPYVFYGGEEDPKRDWTAWKALLVRAGVCSPEMTLGEMPELAAGRTTTGTLLRDAGVDATIVRDILGHSQVQVTQESYQRTDQPTMQAAMTALASQVREPTKKRASRKPKGTK